MGLILIETKANGTQENHKLCTFFTLYSAFWLLADPKACLPQRTTITRGRLASLAIHR